jgi:hypothetical protein
MSHLVFKNSNFFKAIKVGVIFMFFEYESFFKKYMIGNSIQFDDEVTRLAQNNTWGNEATCLAASMLFNRPLITLSGFVPQIFNPLASHVMIQLF